MPLGELVQRIDLQRKMGPEAGVAGDGVLVCSNHVYGCRGVCPTTSWIAKPMMGPVF